MLHMSLATTQSSKESLQGLRFTKCDQKSLIFHLFSDNRSECITSVTTMPYLHVTSSTQVYHSMMESELYMSF